MANEEGGNFYHFPLFVLQGRRISALQSLSILLIKGSVVGVTSDLHLYPPLLASSPMGRGCPMHWVGAWPSLGHDHKGQDRCPLMQPSRLPPSLILASVLGRFNSGSCLCVVTIPLPWSCLGFQLLVPGLAVRLHI